MCSRRVYELETEGKTTVSLHCVENGNYEPLQCVDDWCYCVHPENGTIWGYQMPEAAINLLPCCKFYFIGILGGQWYKNLVIIAYNLLIISHYILEIDNIMNRI